MALFNYKYFLRFSEKYWEIVSTKSRINTIKVRHQRNAQKQRLIGIREIDRNYLVLLYFFYYIFFLL